jgi:hypothetical protein
LNHRNGRLGPNGSKHIIAKPNFGARPYAPSAAIQKDRRHTALPSQFTHNLWG